MTITSGTDEVLARITEFVRREFLGELEDDEAADLRPATPLLQLGILNSQNTGRLLAFIHEEFGIAVPPTEITATRFRDLNAITALVATLRDA